MVIMIIFPLCPFKAFQQQNNKINCLKSVLTATVCHVCTTLFSRLPGMTDAWFCFSFILMSEPLYFIKLAKPLIGGIRDFKIITNNTF